MLVKSNLKTIALLILAVGVLVLISSQSCESRATHPKDHGKHNDDDPSSEEHAANGDEHEDKDSRSGVSEKNEEEGESEDEKGKDVGIAKKAATKVNKEHDGDSEKSESDITKSEDSRSSLAKKPEKDSDDDGNKERSAAKPTHKPPRPYIDRPICRIRHWRNGTISLVPDKSKLSRAQSESDDGDDDENKAIEAATDEPPKSLRYEAERAEKAEDKSTNSKKKKKSRQGSKKKNHGKHRNDNDEESDPSDKAEGESRMFGGMLAGAPPGWISQVRLDESNFVAEHTARCQGAKLLGFAVRIDANRLILHERTFNQMMRNSGVGQAGIGGAKKDQYMMPIQHPVPETISPQGMGSECMPRLGFKIEMNRENNIGGFNVYKYQRNNQILGGAAAESYTLADLDLTKTEPVGCTLYGWTLLPMNGKAQGNSMRFAHIELDKVSCENHNSMCKFKPKHRVGGSVCSNDIGLPVVCGPSRKVHYVVGPPLPGGGCQPMGPNAIFTTYSIADIMSGVRL